MTSALGIGTTFLITIPTVLAEKRVEPDLEIHQEESKQLVMVIDDDPSQRELLTRFLEREGFALQEASDGRAGL